MTVTYDPYLEMVTISTGTSEPIVMTKEQAADLRFSIERALANPGARMTFADVQDSWQARTQ